MRSALVPVLALLVSSMVPLAAPAADRSEVMRSRYLRWQFCMEKTYQQGFADRLALVMVINRWGASEPTRRSVLAQSAKVQKVDAECRKANELEDERRPG